MADNFTRPDQRPEDMGTLLRSLATAADPYFEGDVPGGEFTPEPTTETSFAVWEIPLSWIVKNTYEHWELVHLACLWKRTNKRKIHDVGNGFVLYYFPQGMHPDMPWEGPSNPKWYREYAGSGEINDKSKIDKKREFKDHMYFSRPAGKSQAQPFFECAVAFFGVFFSSPLMYNTLKDLLTKGPSIWIAGPCVIPSSHMPKGNGQTVMRICHGISYRPSMAGVFVNLVASYSDTVAKICNLYEWKLGPDLFQSSAEELGFIKKSHRGEHFMRSSRFCVLTMQLIQKLQRIQKSKHDIYLQCSAEIFGSIQWMVYGFMMSTIHQTVDSEVNHSYPTCPLSGADALPTALGYAAEAGLLFYQSGEQDPLVRMWVMKFKIQEINPPGQLYYQKWTKNANPTPPPDFECSENGEFLQWGLHSMLDEYLFRIPFPEPISDLESTKEGGIIDSIGRTNIRDYESFKTRTLHLDNASERLVVEHHDCALDTTTLPNASTEEELERLGNVNANQYVLSYLLNPSGRAMTLDLGAGGHGETTEVSNQINMSCWYLSILFVFYGGKFHDWNYRDLRNFLTAMVKKSLRLPPYAHGIVDYSEPIQQFISFMLSMFHTSDYNIIVPNFDVTTHAFDNHAIAVASMAKHRRIQEDVTSDWEDLVFHEKEPADERVFSLFDFALSTLRGGFYLSPKKVTVSLIEATRPRYVWEFVDEESFNKYKDLRFEQWRSSGASDVRVQQKIDTFISDIAYQRSVGNTNVFNWRIVHTHGPEFDSVIQNQSTYLNFVIARVDGTHFVPVVPGSQFEHWVKMRNSSPFLLHDEPTFFPLDFSPPTVPPPSAPSPETPPRTPPRTPPPNPAKRTGKRPPPAATNESDEDGSGTESDATEVPDVEDFSQMKSPSKRHKYLTKTYFNLTKPATRRGDSPIGLETDNADCIAEGVYMKTWWRRENVQSNEGPSNDYKYISKGRRVYIPIHFNKHEKSQVARWRIRDCRRRANDWPFAKNIGPGPRVSLTRSCYNFPSTMNRWYGWKWDGTIRVVNANWVQKECPDFYKEVVENYRNDPQKWHGYFLHWPKGSVGARGDSGDKSGISLQDISILDRSSKYMQGHYKICIVASFASALHALFDKTEAKQKWVERMMIHAYNRKWDMPIGKQEFVEMVNRCARGHILRRLKDEELGSDFFVKFQTEPYFSKCISLSLQQKDGKTPHAIALYRGVVFDSTVKHCLKLCRETFEFLCAPVGFDQIERAYILEEIRK